MNNQDVMTMWAEALKMSNDGRFDPSGKGASVHGIFAAMVLEKAAQHFDSNPHAERFNNGIADDLRMMAEGLKP